ncbi:hypothetical protein [Micromonospora sp. NPDC048839]|uniref:hypothetical protein n=1 Tax=Micromonospora sp. NPDC048839 TaxID=3155641 RepID=UPI0033EE2CB6
MATDGPITASALPGTAFHGEGRAQADPDAVLDRARAALPGVAAHAGVQAVAALADGTYQVTRADGSQFNLRVDSGPVADRAVAASAFDPDGTAVVTVSDRAADAVIDRAVAHEVAELAAVGQPLAEGTAVVTPLSPADVAELVTAAHQVRTANSSSRTAVRRELSAVVDRLGLRDGMLGSEQKMAALPADVRAELADATSHRSTWASERLGLRAERRTALAEANGRPVGLPRMRTYLATHFTVNTLLVALATKLTLDAGGRPEVALMLGAGAVVGAVATGPAKWLAKRSGLAAEDRRARYDTRQDARTAAETDTTAAEALAAQTGDASPAVQELGEAVTGLGEQLAAVHEQLWQGERRQRLMGQPRQFPPVGGDPAAAGRDSGNGTTSTDGQGGPSQVGLTPHEQGRLAELRALAARHDGARPWARPGAGREIRALLDSLGLRQGTPGVQQRRDLLPADVRPLVDRFGGSRTAAVRDRARAVVDRHPADGQRPGKVAPWWMSVTENAPNLLTAATIVGVGDILGQLQLGWSGIAGALAAAATGVAVDPVVARKEAAAKDARDTWDVDHPALPAEALLSQATQALIDPISAVDARAAEAVQRTVDLGQRLADLERRLAESQRRNGVADSFRNLLFGNPAWAGLAPPNANIPAPRPSTDPATSTGPAAAPSADPRTPSLQRLAELAARHEAAGPMARSSVARQLRVLVDQLGLREGTPGVDQRRELVPAELRPVVERHGRPGLPDRATQWLSRTPAQATDSTARPSNVPNLGVYAVEQTPGPLIQAGTTVGVAQALQVAAGAGPGNMLAGGLLSPLRDLLLKRVEARFKDARRTWDLANPNPAMDPTARVAGLAGPSTTTLTDAAGQLDVASRRLGDINATLEGLAQGRTTAPGTTSPETGATTPGSTDPTAGADPAAATGTPDSAATTPDQNQEGVGPDPLSRADAWEVQTAAHHVRTADRVSLKPALRELHAVIDRLGLRDGMLGAPDRVAQLPPEAQQVVAEFGGDRSGRARQLRTLRGERRSAEDARPAGIPRLRTYLVSSVLTTAATAGAATAIAFAVASPLAPVIPIAAVAAAPVIGLAKWHAKRQSLAADDVRTRFDGRSDARDAANRVDQVIDRLNEPVAELEQAADRVEGRLAAAEVATDRLAERLAETHRRNGLLSRLLGTADNGRTDPAATNPESGGNPDNPTDPAGNGDPGTDSGRITAAAVPNSGFHGLGRPTADPAAVLDTARAAMPQVATFAGVNEVTAVGPDTFEVRAAGLNPLRVQLSVGPLTDGVVAQSTRNPDGSFTVTVSDRAVDGVVARALAHEVAELVALHEAGQALVGPLDPGNVQGLIDPAGLTAHDRGRMAEIRQLAAEYETGDQATRLAVRAEIDALVDHLGLRVGDPAARARWAALPPDALAHLMRLSVPSVTPEAVAAVLKGSPTPTDVERFRMIDYRARLAPDFQVPATTELDARLRELAVQGEQAQTSLPRMPAYAGQIIAMLPAQLDLIRQVDPQLADRIAAQGVYVDLTGQFDLRPYAVDSQPEIGLGDARPAFDLGTPDGRQALLAEDRVRARATLRGRTSGRPVRLLSTHDFHYLGAGRVMGLVPDALTQLLGGFSPIAEATTAETTVAVGPAETAVVADRVTLPAAEAGKPGVVYGQALDSRTGQPPPLFDGPPKREDVQQGMLGDCGMIAVIGAVAGQVPAALADVFHVNSDGTVDVLLHETSLPGSSVTPTGRRLRITVQPDVPLQPGPDGPPRPGRDGQTAYADQSTVGVAWASLLEKAIAAVDRTWTQDRHDQWQRQWTNQPGVNDTQAAPLGYARLNNGSSRLAQAELLSQLTGLPTSVNQLDTTPGQEAVAEARLAELLAAGSPVITGTRSASTYPTGTLPHGLYAGHAYEVVGVANGEVQLRNPWNSKHPTPMPVRAFLDLMSPWYAHVELARTATPAVPGSSFNGLGRPAADAVAVVDAARAALPTVTAAVRAHQIVAVTADRFEVRVSGLDPLSVRVAAGPLADGAVAQTVRHLDGSFTLTVSDRATDAAVTRALAHEVAELVALHDTGQALVGQLDVDHRDGPIDPTGLTAQDQGRLAELRVLAASYAGAGPAARLTLRTEIDALAEHLGLRLGTPDSHARWGVLPGDVAIHLMQLSVPLVSPDSIAGVLRGMPSSMVERFRAIDYRSRLAPDFTVPAAAVVDARLRELAIQGEQAQSSLPRMPACAGQIIGLPPAQLDLIRQADPQLADRIAAEGVYVDLTGRFDLRPFVLDGVSEMKLAESTAAFDLGTEVGRRSLLAEDRVRTRAAYRAEYGANPAAVALLNTHDFHYLTTARVLALVPDVLARALHSLVPGAPPLDVEVEATVTAHETAVVADRVTLPAPKKNQVVPEYGQARDPRTGQPAPLFDGPPRREQVRQGLLGDCGMLASAAAVAGYRPDVIAQLFQPNPDGTVDVLLHESTLLGNAINPTGRRLRITVQPDVPLRSGNNGVTAYADQSANGSSWASLLEKALAAVDRTWSAERHVQWQRDWLSWQRPPDPHMAAPTGYARLNVGSRPRMQAELLTQLTGVPSRAAMFDRTPGREAAVEARLAALLAAGSPVITGTKSEDRYPLAIRKRLPHGLYAGHAYEMVAVSKGQVQLRNPWNKDHPTPMTVREFLDLMDPEYAYLQPQPAPPVATSGAAAALPLPPPPSLPLPPPPPLPPHLPPAPPYSPAPPEHVPRRHTLGRTHLEEPRFVIVYYALLAGDGTVSGLGVVEPSEQGQRSAHWTVGGAPPGAGGSLPVGRAEAERIAREVLGFALPDEATLHDMLDG